MVDLPSTPEHIPTIQAPQSRVSPAQIASPYLEMADTFEKASKETEKFAERKAEEAGLQSVTRDENGNVKVERPFIVGEGPIRSYERGMKVAAVADGENEVRTGLLALRHKSENDPESFRGAAAKYIKDTTAQYTKAAGPLVGVTIGRIGQDTAREIHENLLNQKERRDLTQATASIEAQIDTTKNEMFAIASGGDTSSPDFTQRLQKVGALYNQLLSNPKLNVAPARIEYEMRQLRSELDVASLDHTLGQTQKTKGIDAAMAEAERVRTDPSLNLTPQQRLTYYSRLVTGINQRARADALVTKQVAGEIEAVGNIAADGYPVTPQRMAILRRTVAESGSPTLTTALQEVETALPTVQSWRQMSPMQLERSLGDLDRTMREGGAGEGAIALKTVGDKLLTTMRKEVSSDPLNWADRTGAVKVPDIDWSDKGHATLATQLQNRKALAETAAAHYGIPPSYLKPDERQALQTIAAQGGPQMLAVAHTIVDGFGDRAPRVLAEIGKDSPVLAHLGGLINSNGSPSLINDAAQAVALKQNKEFTHPRWLAKESDAIQAEHQKVVIGTYGSAFILAGEAGRAATQTADNAFFTRSARLGYDPKLEESGSRAVYDKTLQEAAGATFDPKGVRYGGIAEYGTKPGTWLTGNKVLIPGNIRSDQFGKVIGALRDEDVAGAVGRDGRPMRARDIQNTIPVAARGGYRFSMGDPTSDDPRWIAGTNGQPFTLSLEKLEPALRQRVPGAYAGGP